MKKAYIAGIAVVVIAVFTYLFYRKTYLDFTLVCTVEQSHGFYPDAYVFIHSEEQLRLFLATNKRTKLMYSICGETFEADKYSYVIVFGRKAKTMYYSAKTTYFDDKSAHYAKHNGKDVVFIEYDMDSPDAIYIYKLEKNPELRGFFGI